MGLEPPLTILTPSPSGEQTPTRQPAEDDSFHLRATNVIPGFVPSLSEAAALKSFQRGGKT